MNLNNPHALTLASEATAACLPGAPGFLTSDSDLLPAGSEVNRRRDTGRPPAGLWHDLCAPAKGGLWEASGAHEELQVMVILRPLLES